MHSALDARSPAWGKIKLAAVSGIVGVALGFAIALRLSRTEVRA